MLLFVLLYQAGGFALRFIAQDTNTFEAGETIVVEMPISLPYSTDWQAPQEVSGEIRQGDKSPAKSKLINTLVKEYCAHASAWVLYIMDWPTDSLAPSHLVLPATAISADFFSPPRQA